MVNQIAFEHGVYLNVPYCWKKQSPKKFSKLFEDKNICECNRQADHNHKVN